MREYTIDAKNMDEKTLNRSIKEHALDYDKLIIKIHNLNTTLQQD